MVNGTLRFRWRAGVPQRAQKNGPPRPLIVIWTRPIAPCDMDVLHPTKKTKIDQNLAA